MASIKGNKSKARDLSMNKQMLENPGPGQYTKSDEDFGKNGLKFKIGEKIQQKAKNNIPGPGQYEASDSLTKTFAPSFK